MNIDIGNKVKHYIDYAKVRLPRKSESYYLAFESIGKGSLISACIRFNSHDILIKIEIDGEVMTEIDIKKFREMLKYSWSELRQGSPIVYNEARKMLEVQFTNPLSFKDGIKIFAKANRNSSSRELKGYSVFLGVS